MVELEGYDERWSKNREYYGFQIAWPKDRQTLLSERGHMAHSG